MENQSVYSQVMMSGSKRSRYGKDYNREKLYNDYNWMENRNNKCRTGKLEIE